MSNNLITSKIVSDLKEIETSIFNISNSAEKIGNNLDKVAQLQSLFIESKKLDIQMQQLRNDLAEIISNHKQEMSLITNIFLERKYVIDKLFAIIDQGIITNNDQLVFMSMNLINATLERNPLLILQQYKNPNNTIDFNNNKPLEIDF